MNEPARGTARIVSNEPGNGTLFEVRCWYCCKLGKSLTLLHLSEYETHRFKEACTHCGKTNLYICPGFTAPGRYS